MVRSWRVYVIDVAMESDGTPTVGASVENE